jgi:hypothetical protein
MVLLRRFEPVARYAKGNVFFPMDIRPYIGSSSLWLHCWPEGSRLLVQKGELTPEVLAEASQTRDPKGFHFMKFVDPVGLAAYAQHRLTEIREELIGGQGAETSPPLGGRLVRVGYLSRFIDAIFSISLLSRGHVAGETALAAALAYRQMRSADERYPYYGRVVRQEDWIIVQYWFFYPFNNWRSGFFGANDHEADWEMASVYCWETPNGEVKPEWVAYSAHDYSGGDLRRHWEDPELEKVGEHPVMNVAAGSHAGYFRVGEYVTEVAIALPGPLARAAQEMDRLRSMLSTSDAFSPGGGKTVFLRVPFVDYALGNGFTIGEEGERAWDACLLEPLPDWAAGYRGLWGLYTGGFMGENAPAGPLYERDGMMRRSWYDPVGWADLDVVPVPGKIPSLIERLRTEVCERERVTREALAEKGTELRMRAVEAAALEEGHYPRNVQDASRTEMRTLAKEVEGLRVSLAHCAERGRAIDAYSGLPKGQAVERERFRRPLVPSAEPDLRLGRLAEIWAAVSIGVAIIAILGLALISREFLIRGIVTLVLLLVGIEAAFRRRLQRFLSGTALLLASLATLILLYEFARFAIVAAFLIVALYVLIQNLKELWATR